ncbi:uncharacterized protein C8Q71DRAFT_798855 [Rhodofomes roseus]|uniref:Uncharacterized protein n=1 Tax=Rhodofomes roseus TaxID=34475 RepID=A0ABQ8K4R1_9APHY|nr:uncharacterized protein C8Q71DRAFT_798855 [Rhodofomes roseus]KAH9831856.1 hypothetical protein C8Q71DRAFT_798855 [Rhodofomes roseus]
MPNPDRLLADGLEWECPPVIVFIDDVSGNSTKQWNVHYSCYLSNGGLPREMLDQDCHIRFVATSPHASPMEIIEGICSELREICNGEPIKAWDSVKGCHVLVRPWLMLLPGDNPMQAELCSHIGLGGNFFCRCCHAGGTKEFRESDEGFKTLMEPGIARTVNETRDAILQHLIMATHAAADKRLKDAISTSGVKDSFAMPIINRLVAIGKALRRSTPTRKAVSPEEVNKHLTEELLKKKDTTTMNPLLRMEGFDVHKDTPVEPLHTVILGIIKYFWGQTVWILEKQGKFAEFRAKLSSLGRSGLRIPNIMADYLCRYRSSLIGKHFKTLSQIMAFAVCGLVDQDLQDTWFALGRLTVLIWETEITNMSAYVKDLRDAIRDVMDFAAKQSPSLITLKNKFHILSHLPDHIERFGPALLFSTERYESFNRIFRLCSIHSNRQAPSRDIAMAFANQDRCRHMITGGYWLDKMSKQWVRAGAAVTEHFKTDRHDAHLLGVDIPEPPEPGRMTFPAQPRGPRIRTDSKQDSDRVLDWTDTEAGRLGLTAPHGDYHWQSAVSVVATEGDVVGVGNEVLVRQEGGQYSPLGFASVVEILFGTPSNTSDHSSRSLRVVVVQMSQLDDAPHQKLRMPTLHRTGDVRLYPAQDIVCAVNIQHDCSKHGCSETGTESIRQEREETTRTRAITKHHDSTDYVVNVLALHNQRLLREALPEPLRVKPVFFTDRAQLHKDAAVSLRDQKLQKKLTKDAAILCTMCRLCQSLLYMGMVAGAGVLVLVGVGVGAGAGTDQNMGVEMGMDMDVLGMTSTPALNRLNYRRDHFP